MKVAILDIWFSNHVLLCTALWCLCTPGRGAAKSLRLFTLFHMMLAQFLTIYTRSGELPSIFHLPDLENSPRNKSVCVSWPHSIGGLYGIHLNPHSVQTLCPSPCSRLRDHRGQGWYIQSMYVHVYCCIIDIQQNQTKWWHGGLKPLSTFTYTFEVGNFKSV